MLLLSHILHLFFIFSFLILNFSPNSLKKKKKVFFSLSVHTYYYISSNFSPPFLPLYLSTTLCFTIRVLSSFYLSYILTLFLPILFCLNLISFLPFNPYFSHTKMWVLYFSPSHLFWWIFILPYNSN